MSLIRLMGGAIGKAWEITDYSTGVSRSTGNGISGVAFTMSSDGAYLYTLSLNSTSSAVFRYTLSIPWDISTASFPTYTSFVVGAQASSPEGLTLSQDGSKLYITNGSTDTIYQYSLSTAWAITTATYTASRLISAQTNNPTGIFFTTDGLNMYVASDNLDTIYQYSLSTAWDITTATYTTKNKSVGAEVSIPYGVFFSTDGTNMYVAGGLVSSQRIAQYTLSTAWDISTAVFKQAKITTEYQYGVVFKPDGTLFFTGTTNTVYQYKLIGT